MEFFNIGGGELLVIILLALVLFRPEDIYKAMRQLGRYTRSARLMWREFMDNMKREMDAQEVADALKETRASIKETQQAISALETSVSDVKKTVESDVAEAGKSLKAQATDSAKTLETEAAESAGATAVAEAAGTAAAAAVEAVEEAQEAVADARATTKKTSSFTEEVAARVREAQAAAAAEATPAGPTSQENAAQAESGAPGDVEPEPLAAAEAGAGLDGDNAVEPTSSEDQLPARELAAPAPAPETAPAATADGEPVVAATTDEAVESTMPPSGPVEEPEADAGTDLPEPVDEEPEVLPALTDEVEEQPLDLNTDTATPEPLPADAETLPQETPEDTATPAAAAPAPPEDLAALDLAETAATLGETEILTEAERDEHASSDEDAVTDPVAPAPSPETGEES